MPWSKATVRAAYAVKTGKSHLFKKDFAEQVIREGVKEDDSDIKRRKKAEDKLGKGARMAPK